MFYKKKYEDLYDEHSFMLEENSKLSLANSKLSAENTRLMSHNIYLMEQLDQLKTLLLMDQIETASV